MSDFFRGAMATDCPEFASKFAKPETKKIYTLNKPINFPVRKFTPSQEDTYVFRDTETNKWYDIDGKEIEKPQNALKVRILEPSKSKMKIVSLIRLRRIHREKLPEEELEKILQEFGLLPMVMNHRIMKAGKMATLSERLFKVLDLMLPNTLHVGYKVKKGAAIFYVKYSLGHEYIYNLQYTTEQKMRLNTIVEALAGEIVRGLIGNRDNTHTIKSCYVATILDETNNHPYAIQNGEMHLLYSRNVQHGLPDDYDIRIRINHSSLLQEFAARMIIGDYDGHTGNILQYISVDNKIHTIGYDYEAAYSGRYPTSARRRIIQCLAQVSSEDCRALSDRDLMRLYMSYENRAPEDESLYIDVLVDLLEKAIIMFVEQKILLESQDYVECMFVTAELPSPELNAKELVQLLHKESLSNIQLYANFLYVIATDQWNLDDITSAPLQEDNLLAPQDAQNITKFCQKYHLHTRIQEVLAKHDMMDMLTVPLQQKPPSPVPQQELTALTITESYITCQQEI